MQPSDFPMITVAYDDSKFFAVLVELDDDGMPELSWSGFGRYPKTPQGELAAIAEAKEWAEDEGIRLDPKVLERENQLNRQLAAADRYGPFDMVAGQTDPMEDVP